MYFSADIRLKYGTSSERNDHQMNGNNVVLIPALNPSETLIDYVQELISAGFERIVVVDDGSAAENQYIFSELEDNDQVFCCITPKIMAREEH